jgi:hypothetical protein
MAGIQGAGRCLLSGVLARDRVSTGLRDAERWRGLRFTEFELRQIAVVRKDLDDEYQTTITPLAPSAQPRVSP